MKVVEKWGPKIYTSLFFSGIHVQSLVQMACDSRLLDSDSRTRALQTIATNVVDALHVKHQVVNQLLLFFPFQKSFHFNFLDGT